MQGEMVQIRCSVLPDSIFSGVGGLGADGSQEIPHSKKVILEKRLLCLGLTPPPPPNQLFTHSQQSRARVPQSMYTTNLNLPAIRRETEISLIVLVCIQSLLPNPPTPPPPTHEQMERLSFKRNGLSQR